MPIVLLLLAAACAPAPTKLDEDNDGSPAAEDCDDQDPTVHPGADERCDASGTDEDCDGRVNGDDPDVIDRLYLHRDEDGDGYGDASTRTSTCPGAGWVEDGTDCDDADAAVHPGQPEVCDLAGTDEDCDGRVNGADDDHGPLLDWWPDADGDGWGAGDPVPACDAPAGHVSLDGDCDDADAAVNPAAVEVCDQRDDDCDGTTDEGVTVQVWTDADADGHGAGDPYAGCLDATTATDGGDCDDADPDAYPGAPEVCGDGVDQDCEPGPAECDLEGERDQFTADITLLGQFTDDRAGSAVAALGDVDGDGVQDWGLGAPGAAFGGNARGRVVLYASDREGRLAEPEASVRIAGTTDYDFLGGALLALGDVDGDGADDFAIGAPGLGGGGGLVTFTGPLAGTLTTSDAALRVESQSAFDGAGSGLWLTEADGDADSELWTSGPEAAVGGAGRGGVWLLDPGATGSTTLQAIALAEVSGTEDDAALGTGLATPDLDGDGVDDLVLGAPEADGGRGRAYVFLGPSSGRMDDTAADGRLDGPDANAGFGAALLSPGDLDGDGADDLVVGAPTRDGAAYEAGALWVLVGPSPDPETPRASFEGEGEWEEAGSALAAAGDADGDGIPDLWLGAPGWPGGDGRGRVYLVEGARVGTWNLGDLPTQVSGVLEGGGFASVLAAPDLDGDGRRDLLVGSPTGEGDEPTSGLAQAFLDRDE